MRGEGWVFSGARRGWMGWGEEKWRGGVVLLAGRGGGGDKTRRPREITRRTKTTCRNGPKRRRIKRNRNGRSKEEI